MVNIRHIEQCVIVCQRHSPFPIIGCCDTGFGIMCHEVKFCILYSLGLSKIVSIGAPWAMD
jgi:hypothetical protein